MVVIRLRGTQLKQIGMRRLLVNENNVLVKSKLQHAPPPLPEQTRGHLTFLKIIVQIPPYTGQNAVQMPHRLGSVQVIKCPHPGDISKAHK